jgi:hypothetical protein
MSEVELMRKHLFGKVDIGLAETPRLTVSPARVVYVLVEACGCISGAITSDYPDDIAAAIASGSRVEPRDLPLTLPVPCGFHRKVAECGADSTGAGGSGV